MVKGLALILLLLAGPAGAQWAEEKLAEMTTLEKIGQLFMLPVPLKRSKEELAALEDAVAEKGIGGIILYSAPAGEHLEAVARFQAAAKLPLLVALDAEWGAAMRIKGATAFPRNLALGALADDALIEEIGAETGRELRDLGVSMNFAPVVDVNNNPDNPVINDRSFGESPDKVAAKGLAFLRGLQEAGVLATAKHFPGHGDTAVDSHLALPKIEHGLARLEEVELAPFKRLIAAGVDAVMTAHLYVPALDARPDRPTSLSSAVVQGLLRERLGFAGLIVTDALQMNAVRDHFKPGDEALEAALAGNDILLLGTMDEKVDKLLSENLPEGMRKIHLAVEDGRLPREQLDARVLRLLKAKESLGLHEDRRTASGGSAVLRRAGALRLRQKALDGALTLVKNDGLLPLAPGRKTAYVRIGETPALLERLPLARLLGKTEDPLRAVLEKRPGARAFTLAADAGDKRVEKILKRLDAYDAVVVALHGMSRSPARNFGVSRGTLRLLETLYSKGKRVALAVFGNPYSLKFFGQEQAIFVAYESSPEAEEAVARALSGSLNPSGKLPVSASAVFPAGTGLSY